MSVTTQPEAPKTNGHSSLSPSITSALSSLRAKIRAYVWMQGLGLVLAFLGLAFWISLAIDWLPVPFGNDEPGVPVRVGVLVLVGIGVIYLFVRYIFRRSAVPLRDRNMAVLLERRFREFDDSLLTAVELTEQPSHASSFNREMLDHTSKIAVDKTGKIHVSDVLNPGPRMLAVVAALVLLGSVAAFAVAAPSGFSTWFNRAVLLQDDLWPRTNHIAIDGPQILKVPRGENVTIRVFATTENGKQLPSNVRMDYVNEDGVEGSTNLDRHAPQNGTQEFSHTIYGMLSSIDFDVVGGDHRVRDYRIEVVDRPSVQLTLQCEYPDYMITEDSFDFPYEIAVSRTVEIPRGTKLTLKAEATKPLQRVMLLPDEMIEGDMEREIPLDDPTNFTLEIPNLDTDQLLQFTLLDTDQVAAKEPVRLSIVAMPDLPPEVDARLRGIGTAVTPDVVIPLVGELHDDHGLDRAFWDFVVTNGEQQRAATRIDFNSFQSGRRTQLYDLEEEQQESLDIRALRREEVRRRNEEAGGQTPPAGDNSGSGDMDDAVVEIGVGDIDDGLVQPLSGAADIESGAPNSPTRLDYGPQPNASFLTAWQDGNASDPQGNDNQQANNKETEDQDDPNAEPAAPVDPSNPFQLIPGEKLQISIVTADACTLDGEPNYGRSQVFTLDVVTPQRLRSILAARELALRKRFEDQLIVEFEGSIDLISGLDFAAIEAAPAEVDSSDNPQLLNILSQPGNRLATRRQENAGPLRQKLMQRDFTHRALPVFALVSSQTPLAGILWQQQPGLEPGERPLELKQKTKGELMLQAEADVREVILRSQKNGNEIVGVAEGFEDILLEFTNNRVQDAEELTTRIRENIADPLRTIGEEMFPKLDEKLIYLQENMKNQGTREQAVLDVEQYMVEIDDAMQTVLSHMLQLESYEELVEKMREIIEIQDRINRDTGTYRRQEIFGGGDGDGGE